MKFGKVLLITFFLVSETLEEAEFNIIMDATEHILPLTDKDIHRIVNGMFKSLMITPFFLTSKQVQKELRTYKYLRNTAGSNYKIYKYIGHTSKSADKKSYLDGDVNNTINDVLNETFSFPHIEATLKDEFLRYVVGQTRRLNNDAQQVDLSFELIINFLNKINDLRKEGVLKDKWKMIEDTFKIQSSANKTEESSIGAHLWESTSSEDPEPTRRFFNARPTTIRNYSFMASIAMDGWLMCAGSIISVDTVVTAASCLQKLFVDAQKGRKLSLVTVRVGSEFAESLGDLMPAKGAIFHPEYNPFNLNNNIAILRLMSNNIYQKKWIKRIPIEREDFDISKTVKKNKKEFKVLGWGKRDNSKISVSRLPLSYDKLEWYDTEACKNIYTKHYVTDKNFCLGSVTGQSGACEKDLGTPAIYQGKLIGITSFSAPECGTVNVPTVFVKIAPYAEWIDSVVKDKNSNNIQQPQYERASTIKPINVVLEENTDYTSDHTTIRTSDDFNVSWATWQNTFTRGLMSYQETNDSNSNSGSKHEAEFGSVKLHPRLLSKIKQILTPETSETTQTPPTPQIYVTNNTKGQKESRLPEKLVTNKTALETVADEDNNFYYT